MRAQEGRSQVRMVGKGQIIRAVPGGIQAVKSIIWYERPLAVMWRRTGTGKGEIRDQVGSWGLLEKEG